MKCIVFLVIVIFYAISDTNAQLNEINFEKKLSWSQVKQKAVKEGKFIFLDCSIKSSSKTREKDVFTKKPVIDLINAHFISAKVKADTSQFDDADVIAWYKDVHDIVSGLKITTYPAYLFFDNAGRAVHAYAGHISGKDFQQLAADALDTAKQYYRFLELFKEGAGQYAKMPYMIRIAQSLRDRENVMLLTRAYVNDFIYKLPEKEQLTKENISFIRSVVTNSKDNGFNLIRNHSKAINVLMGNNFYAESAIDAIIAKEFVSPLPAPPDWKLMYDKINSVFGRVYAGRVILNEKIRWYSDKKDWKQVTRSFLDRMEKYDFDTSWFGRSYINNTIFSVIFEYSNDSVDLNRAIKLMKHIVSVDPDPAKMDTYANLLYKVGKVDEAIVVQEQAAQLAPDFEGILDNLSKMKRKEPTWSNR